MNINSNKEYMIFEKDGKYKIGLSKKNQDGSYDKAYFPIMFNKDVKLENKTKIILQNAWIDFWNYEYEGKKGTKFYIRCSAFAYSNQEIIKEEKSIDPYEEFGNGIKAEEIDDVNNPQLPF